MPSHQDGAALELQRMSTSPRSSLQEGEEDAASMAGYSPVYTDRLHDDAASDLDRRTVRKLDFVLLPFLALLFLFNSLDRSNVSSFLPYTSRLLTSSR
jgi:hypothetical protein